MISPFLSAAVGGNREEIWANRVPKAAPIDEQKYPHFGWNTTFRKKTPIHTMLSGNDGAILALNFFSSEQVIIDKNP